MTPDSLDGTRAIAAASVVEMAVKIATMAAWSAWPCCWSTVRLSQPWPANCSAEMALGSISQQLVAALPEAQICFSLLGRMGRT